MFLTSYLQNPDAGLFVKDFFFILHNPRYIRLLKFSLQHLYISHSTVWFGENLLIRNFSMRLVYSTPNANPNPNCNPNYSMGLVYA